MDRGLRYTWGFNDQIGDEDDFDGLGTTNEELFGPEAGRPLDAICRRALAGARCPQRDRARAARAASSPSTSPSGRCAMTSGAVIGVAGAAYNLTPRAPTASSAS